MKPGRRTVVSFSERQAPGPGAILVLGPSEYLVPNALHAIEDAPLKVRKDLASYLSDHVGDRATVMEEWKLHPGESSTELFERILREAPVRAFIIYWPLGAKLLGLEWEFGILAQKFLHARFPPERVFILVERGLLHDRPEHGTVEVVALDEKGNRTRYHQDLLRFGCKVRVWDDVESLLRHASEVQLETTGLPAWDWPLALRET